MAGHTTHYNLIKPTSAERVAVGDINDNSDIIDGNLFTANERADQMADDYNTSETYNTGDYVRRENYLYKCNTDDTTGTWDATKWDRVKVMEEIPRGGGGGSSTLAGLNDVNISSPTDGQALIYDNATQKWVNGAGGGGSSTFAGLNDVNVTGVQNGDIARYNSTTQKWTDSSDLTDLELTVSQLQASVLAITDGHTILDSSGTAMAQEDDLQFVGSNVADDSVNGKTVVTNCINVTQAEYDALVANDADLPDVYYNITDAQPVAVNASNLPYSSTQSTKQKIDEIVEEESYSITQPFTPPYTSNCTLKRCGKIVSFLIEGLWFSSITADANTHIATIPTTLLPTNNITWATPLLDGNENVKGYARAYINKANGQLIVKSSSSLSGTLGIQGNLMWLV